MELKVPSEVPNVTEPSKVPNVTEPSEVPNGPKPSEIPNDVEYSDGSDESEDSDDSDLENLNFWRLARFLRWEHDSGACIYGALVSVDTNNIFSNNEFPILDVGRKIISKDNGEETIKLNGFKLINDVVAKGERGFNVSSFMNEATSKSFEGAFGIVWSRPL
ncbi:hypothetical protein Tco_1451697, partial [Tanacetum coccineum]